MFGRTLGGMMAALAMAALSLLFAGCDLAGTVDVRSDHEIVVDLFVSDASQACVALTDQSLATLNVEVDLGGCRITGRLDPHNPNPGLVTLSAVGENYVLDLDFPEGSGDVPMDLTVTFPGQVLDGGGGRTEYNSVHFERAWGLGAIGKTRIVALNHPGPPWWVLASGGGVLVGALSTLTLLLLRRWRPSQAHGPGAETGLASIVDGATRSEDGNRPAAATPTDWPETVPIAQPIRPVAEPVDHSIWDRPEPE